ncbi:uncharacterized protein LOC124255134 [Haliotis rubra]|uniref:uncharacterized protein LOC124255134 n=1 Tax=Haliotis rubra TaxID=36100 RepID=UPI001EE5F330|nr:uncharacterized protein LOC124255134 [Haliotis rubra]
MASRDKDNGHHLVKATSSESSESHMATSGEHSESDVDMASPDEEHEGHLVPAGSAYEEVPESQAISISTGEQRSGNAQVANTLNIVTGGAGQGTLGRDTLDLRTDEARKIFCSN